MPASRRLLIKAVIPATFLSLLLALGFQSLCYVSEHGLLDEVKSADGIFVSFPILALIVVLTILLAGASACYLLRASLAAQILALAAVLIIPMSFVWREQAFDRARFAVYADEIAEAVALARDKNSISPGEPVALWWGESGFAGMNYFAFLVHDPAGVMNEAKTPSRIFALNRKWKSGGGTRMDGLRCKAAIYRIAVDYVVVRRSC